MLNLLIGIIGGIFSGIIVSRFFMIKTDIDNQIEIIHDMIIDLDNIGDLIDKLIKVSKKVADSSAEFEEKNEIVDVDDWMSKAKSKVLTDSIDNMCVLKRRLELKEAVSLRTVEEVINSITEYKVNNDFSFGEMDNWKDRISDSREQLIKYEKVVSATFIKRVMFDKWMIIMIIICLSIVVVLAILRFM